MKKLIIILLLALFSLIIQARELNVITTYPYISSIAEYIGKDYIKVSSLANGKWNPHTIVPKPSFIGKLRNADLLIINGAQLEIGWLPQLIKQANNPKIQFESKGFLDLSQHVRMIDIPKSVSRAKGDVHPEGNPHFYLCYQNIELIANAILKKLSELSPENKFTFERNHNQFIQNWNKKISSWQSKLEKLKDAKVIEYHKIFDYFLKSWNINIVATIEPLPGIPPTSRHIEELEKLFLQENIKFILQDVYNPDDAAKYLSKKFNIPLLILPHDVDAVIEAKDIFSLYDEIIMRLTND